LVTAGATTRERGRHAVGTIRARLNTRRVHRGSNREK
jgi:hypothetical protein